MRGKISTESLSGCSGCHVAIVDLHEKLFNLVEIGEFVRLPVLMDDILVNFDDDGRQAEAARAIAAFARQRQVILFTCHHATAALFAEVDPDHTRLTLGRC